MEKLNKSFIQYASSVLGDTKKGLTGSEIVNISNKYAVMFNKKIPHPSYPFSIKEASNKAQALNNNLSAFNNEEQFDIITSILEDYRFNDNEDVKELKVLLYRDYGYLSENIFDTQIVAKTINLLSPYEKSVELYESALSKYKNEQFSRNALDDMRLSLELLLKELLDNNQSIEKQKNALGASLKTKNISVYSRNMITSLIQYYTAFQNDHVKHDDDVPKKEVEFIIEITSIIMFFLIKQLYN